jgi:hypothetical protein
MHRVAVFWGDGFGEDGTCLFGVALVADPPEAFGDAVDVSVDGEDFHAEGKHQDAIGGFGANAIEVGEVVESFLWRPILEEFKVVLAGLFLDLVEDGLDARGFDATQAGDADVALNFFCRRFSDFFPGIESAAKLAIAGAAVFVGGVLGEDGFDQDVDRFAAGLPEPGAVLLLEVAKSSSSRSHGWGLCAVYSEKMPSST